MSRARVRVFISYVEEDRAAAKRLSTGLQRAGFEPWLDREQILPGQNWAHTIERAIDTCSFFVACFSRCSVVKRGPFQSELRYAMAAALRVPLDEIYLLPVRLDNCRIPQEIFKTLQQVDLFPDWESGIRQLIKALRHQVAQRGAKLRRAENA